MTPASLLRSAISATVLAALGVVFAISFASIIYGGGAPGLARGIGLGLLGTVVMASVAAFRLTYRDTIVQPQDVTAVILSLAVAEIVAGWQASPDALLATVAALVAMTTALTGAVAWGAGRLRLGFIVRFVPYPLIGGFLAATGYLIVLGAIGMTLHRSVTIWTLGPLLDPANVVLWLPWIAAGALLAFLLKRTDNGFLLPVGILALLAAFYLALLLTGTSIEAARARGLLLGPFGETSLLSGIDPGSFREIAWTEVAAHVPTMLAVAAMALLGGLLNSTGLEIATGREVDADRELRGTGIANLASAPFGAPVGFPVLSMTMFARSLGLGGPFPGLVLALGCLLTILFGADLLSRLPIGVFAAIVAFLGFDLLDSWLRVERRHLPARDFGIVLAILATAATVGFLQALAVGLAAALLLFVVAYSGVEVVRLRTTARHLRSRVERPAPELALLAERGGRAAVHRLGGYLFFGTAHRLLSELGRGKNPAEPPPSFHVLDFHAVSGVDASASFVIGKLCRQLAAGGTEPILADVSPRLLAELGRAGVPTDGSGPLVFPSLELALRHVEDRLLADPPASGAAPRGLLETLAELHPGFEPARHFAEAAAAAGEVIITQGAAPDGMILLLSGRLSAEFVAPDGRIMPVATIRPGTLVGEIGHYAGVPRTARVVAETPCRFLRLDARTLAALAASAPEVAIDLHRLAAANLAHRLMRTTALLHDADV
ncbi:MAG TPA: SulP family inorganic anion transporter [Amaricoccus sp.]|nr:SulP family inorganic anion transporter [Amaricoccus sp.]